MEAAPARLTCRACRKAFEGTLRPWTEYTAGLHEELDTAQMGVANPWAESVVHGYTCAGCGTFVCEACKKKHAGFHWWSGWEKSVCPSCRKRFGPGQVLLS